MFGWKKLDRSYNKRLAYLSSGDRSKTETRWWNHWFLLLVGAWDKVVVLRPKFSGDPIIYRVAYDPDQGSAMERIAVILTPCVAFRMGYEPCQFMAFNADGQQLEWEVVHRSLSVKDVDRRTTTLV